MTQWSFPQIWVDKGAIEFDGGNIEIVVQELH